MKRRDPLLLNHLGQSLGITAVAASYHHHRIHALCHLPDFGLASMGRITDGVKYPEVGKALLDGMGNRIKEPTVLGRLSNHNGPLKGWKLGKIVRVGNHMASAFGISEQSRNLRVVPVTDNQHGVALPGILGNDSLNLDHPGAGGIDNGKSCINKGLLGLR